MENYKHSKEAFVSNLNGSSFSEISAIISIIPVCLLFRHAVVILMCALLGFNKWLFMLCEFVTLIVPCVLHLTVLCDHVISTILLLTLSSIMLLFLSHLKARTQHLQSPVGTATITQWLGMILYPSRVPFLSVARCYNIILSCVAILAVDFHVFPRRFAKAETFGQGLMDTGVGLFVCLHGVVAREVRAQMVTRTTARQYFSGVLHTIRSVVPLVVLGCARLVATWGVQYQEHVSEYGVHWNFFFTLAIVKVVSSMLYPVLPIPPWATGVSLITIYQLSLSHFGLTDYVIYGPHGDGSRDTLIDANREGVVSSLGYISLYFLGMEVGKYIFRPRQRVVLSWLLVATRLFLVAIVMWWGVMLSDQYIQQCSRRLANLTFVLWMVAIVTSVMAAVVVVDTVSLLIEHTTNLKTHFDMYDIVGSGKTQQKQQPSLLTAIDYNQLVFFLMGNLFTGIINLSMNTLAASAAMSTSIILCYMLTLCVLSLVLKHYNIPLL